MIARTEEEIRDKIEELSYIFDISDDLRIRYERSRLSLNSIYERTKSHLYPLQYDDYISYGMILALEWTLGLRQVCGEQRLEQNKNNTREEEEGNKK
jgi:hypothetical protein